MFIPHRRDPATHEIWYRGQWYDESEWPNIVERESDYQDGLEEYLDGHTKGNADCRECGYWTAQGVSFCHRCEKDIKR